MAIYHLSAKPVSRSAGRSATAAAAYRAGAEIADERTGITFDYTRKQGVEHSEIVLPTSVSRQDINWPRDRAVLWNAAELAEHRKDSRVAREYELALPAELNPKQRIELVQNFAQDIADRHGNAVDIAIHAPHRDGDQRNHHAHLLATTRQVKPDGLGDKTVIELSDTDRKKRGLGPAAQEIDAIRQRWAELSNQALQENGHDARVDHRSLATQRQEAHDLGDTERAASLDREPTRHLGVSATAMERRGIPTDLGDINRRIAEAAESGRLERESQAIHRSTLDLGGDLMAALRDRDAARGVQPGGQLIKDTRRDARLAWEQLRSMGKGADRSAEQPSELIDRRQAEDRFEQERLQREQQERETREREERERQRQRDRDGGLTR
jgi:ATP-dependent exoDNAse (exonuclease V) alpha subunit